MGESHPERPITDPRNTRMEKTSRRQRRMEGSLEGGQSPEGALVTWMDGWMDGWMGGWVDGWMDGLECYCTIQVNWS
jgi:hypothetical protein